MTRVEFTNDRQDQGEDHDRDAGDLVIKVHPRHFHRLGSEFSNAANTPNRTVHRHHVEFQNAPAVENIAAETLKDTIARVQRVYGHNYDEAYSLALRLRKQAAPASRAFANAKNPNPAILPPPVRRAPEPDSDKAVAQKSALNRELSAAKKQKPEIDYAKVADALPDDTKKEFNILDTDTDADKEIKLRGGLYQRPSRAYHDVLQALTSHIQGEDGKPEDAIATIKSLFPKFLEAAGLSPDAAQFSNSASRTPLTDAANQRRQMSNALDTVAKEFGWDSARDYDLIFNKAASRNPALFGLPVSAS